MTELYHYRECGLPDVWLDGVERHDTPYGPAVSIPEMDQLHALIGIEIAENAADMSGEEFRFLRRELNWSQTSAGRVCGVSDVTIRRWESGQNIPRSAKITVAAFFMERMTGGPAVEKLVKRIARIDGARTRRRIEMARAADSWTRRAA